MKLQEQRLDEYIKPPSNQDSFSFYLRALPGSSPEEKKLVREFSAMRKKLQGRAEVAGRHKDDPKAQSFSSKVKEFWHEVLSLGKMYTDNKEKLTMSEKNVDELRGFSVSYYGELRKLLQRGEALLKEEYKTLKEDSSAGYITIYNALLEAGENPSSVPIKNDWWEMMKTKLDTFMQNFFSSSQLWGDGGAFLHEMRRLNSERLAVEKWMEVNLTCDIDDDLDGATQSPELAKAYFPLSAALDSNDIQSVITALSNWIAALRRCGLGKGNPLPESMNEGAEDVWKLISDFLSKLRSFFIGHKQDVDSKVKELQGKSQEELQEMVLQVADKARIPREDVVSKVNEGINEGIYTLIKYRLGGAVISLFGGVIVLLSVLLLVYAGWEKNLLFLNPTNSPLTWILSHILIGIKAVGGAVGVAAGSLAAFGGVRIFGKAKEKSTKEDLSQLRTSLLSKIDEYKAASLERRKVIKQEVDVMAKEYEALKEKLKQARTDDVSMKVANFSRDTSKG